jgi:hypothetical protein
MMSRFPAHTVEDAPEASRPLLHKIVQSSPAGRPLNGHGQMAHSPAVLAAYASLRAVLAEHGTLDQKVTWALNLTTAATVGNEYMIGIATRFAAMNGWTAEQVAALRNAATTGDIKIDALTSVAREAAAHAGNVTDATWKAAQQAGWTDAQLAEAFACLGLTVFTSYFLNYAQTELDG